MDRGIRKCKELGERKNQLTRKSVSKPNCKYYISHHILIKIKMESIQYFFKFKYTLMNKIRFSLVLVVGFVLTLPAFSQTEKGNFLIGGSLSFSTSKANGSNSSSISLSPAISYFFLDRLAAGLITPLSFGNTTDSSIPSDFRTSNYSIGPTVRYYFPIVPQWAVFPQIDYSYGWQSSKYNYMTTSNTTKTTSNLFRAGIGITYFIAKNVGLEGILYYQSINGNGSTLSSVNFRVGLQIYLARKI